MKSAYSRWRTACSNSPSLLRVPGADGAPGRAASPPRDAVAVSRTWPALRTMRVTPARYSSHGPDHPLPARRTSLPSVRRVLAASSHDGFRVVHFSIQDDHLHLIVEAEDRAALTRGLRGLAVRSARAVNRALGRRGPVCSDRYHARPLTSPRAVRIALVYVLLNRRKDCAGERGLDPCSS